MNRHAFAFLVAALVAAGAGSARATIVAPAELGELSQSATTIVRGTVLSVTPGWADGRRRIETTVTLEVAQVLKGDPGRTVTFKVPGGVVGRYRTFMVGAPGFREGEEVFLFLGASAPALPYVLGLSQGVFRVRRDAATGQARVISPVLLADPEGRARVVRGDAARRRPTADEFSTLVSEALQGAGGRRRAAGRPDKERH